MCFRCLSALRFLIGSPGAQAVLPSLSHFTTCRTALTATRAVCYGSTYGASWEGYTCKRGMCWFYESHKPRASRWSLSRWRGDCCGWIKSLMFWDIFLFSYHLRMFSYLASLSVVFSRWPKRVSIHFWNLQRRGRAALSRVLKCTIIGRDKMLCAAFWSCFYVCFDCT